MPLLIYTYDADALPSLLEETADAEEAVATCRTLVEEDGYPRAEVWDVDGDRLYAVIRAGESVLTIGSAADVAAHAPPARSADERGRRPAAALVDPAEQERELDLVAAELADARDDRGDDDGASNGASNGAALGATAAATAPAEPATPAAPAAPAAPEPAIPDNLLGGRPGSAELWFGL